MDVEALIAKKQAERAASGLAIRITFEDRAPFTGYYATEEKRNKAIEAATALIGKFHNGSTIKTVEVL